MTTPVTVPPALLLAVHTILAAAIEHLTAHGWSRFGPTISPACGVRLVDALNYGSAHAAQGTEAHLLAFAAAAMAVEPHAGIAAHELLPEPVRDPYLSPDTSDTELHRLDVSIVMRYNIERCGGYEDAHALLHVAYGIAADVIAAQLAYRTQAGAL
jgi:hypothetical protein